MVFSDVSESNLSRDLDTKSTHSKHGEETVL